VGLLLSAPRTGYIDRLVNGAPAAARRAADAMQQALALSSNGASAAGCSSANAGNVTLTADVGGRTQTCFIIAVLH